MKEKKTKDQKLGPSKKQAKSPKKAQEPPKPVERTEEEMVDLTSRVY